MRFWVVNRHNGKKYPAEGQHWPEHGWHVKIFDFAPNAWGRATSGIGPGPVIDQGWQQQLEQRGYTFPELKPPVDVRDQEMKRLAASFQKKPTVAEQLVASLLEDDIPGGKAPDNHRWGRIDKEQLAIGTKVEMEHTRDPHVAEEIAADHLTEDPDYYRKLKKAGLADEL